MAYYQIENVGNQSLGISDTELGGIYSKKEEAVKSFNNLCIKLIKQSGNPFSEVKLRESFYDNYAICEYEGD